MSPDQLSSFLIKVSNWNWLEFVEAEHDKSYTGNQAMVFALIRSCAMQKMDAIRMSLNRIDGKLKTPIKVEMPKVFFIYPNAELPSGSTISIDSATEIVQKSIEVELTTSTEPTEPVEYDLQSMSLRETLTAMGSAPRGLPDAVLALAEHVEMFFRKQATDPGEYPLVKSVVAAHLLTLAQKRDITALTEAFDQIDGKLAETIQMVGDDIYIISYATVAPEGAIVNADGVVQLEAKQAQDLWAQKLGALL